MKLAIKFSFFLFILFFSKFNRFICDAILCLDCFVGFSCYPMQWRSRSERVTRFSKRATHSGTFPLRGLKVSSLITYAEIVHLM